MWLNLCYQLPHILQSNLDYSKCQGPQESFRIIRSFRIFSEKLECFHRTSLFCQKFANSTRVYREVTWNISQRFKENELLGGCGLIVSYACRSKNAEKKIRAYIFISIDNNNENKGLNVNRRSIFTDGILSPFYRPTVIRSPPS